MTVFFIIFGALVVVGVTLRLLHKPDPAPAHGAEAETAAAAPAAADDGDVCCGQHSVCERDSLLTAVNPEIVYYDDEELDRFRGRPAESYTDSEAEEFREVMLTLLPDDVAGWGRSIQMRGIELPEAVRDEFILLIDDIRRSRNARAGS
ncbi:MAG: hypothetical protein NC336_09855 [Clostridium sp.]|nr:hypothetical protein [Clostridium sp.]